MINKIFSTIHQYELVKNLWFISKWEITTIYINHVEYGSFETIGYSWDEWRFKWIR